MIILDDTETISPWSNADNTPTKMKITIENSGGSLADKPYHTGWLYSETTARGWSCTERNGTAESVVAVPK